VPPWLQVFGRLHPVLLHLPIGLLVGLAALEALMAVPRRAGGAPWRSGALAWLAALSAAAAAGSGLVLSREEGYGADPLRWHLWLGLAVAGAALMAAMLEGREPRARYRLALLLTLALLVPAGHLGATMTHGAGYLTRPLARAAAADAPQGGSTHALVVAPILEARCISCHGPAKQRSGLALHTAAGIRAGGEGGAVIVPGDPRRSEMIRRLRLPPDHDDHMPPRGKPQPAAEEIAALEAWIAAGAPFEGRVDGIEAEGAGAAPPRADRAAGSSEPVPPDPAAIELLRGRQVHVEPLGQDSMRLWVDFAGAPETGDAECTELLSPLADHVAELSLARSAVTDGVVGLLGSMRNLARLDLRATAVTDAGLAALSGHGRLEELVVAQTAVTDAGLEHLRAMPALRRVHLWRCAVSPQALARLRAERPELEVEAGDSGLAEPLETEPEIRLSGDAPLPGEQAARAASSLEPLNATCPVSGVPVDPRYAIVHQGRVVGFCCPECPRRFWADPEKYSAALPR
jgi:uncharacterized membrane protein